MLKRSCDEVLCYYKARGILVSHSLPLSPYQVQTYDLALVMPPPRRSKQLNLHHSLSAALLYLSLALLIPCSSDCQTL